MSRKSKKKYTITSQQQFDFDKPKFNGFICGHGKHEDKSKRIPRKKKYKDIEW